MRLRFHPGSHAAHWAIYIKAQAHSFLGSERQLLEMFETVSNYPAAHDPPGGSWSQSAFALQAAYLGRLGRGDEAKANADQLVHEVGYPAWQVLIASCWAMAYIGTAPLKTLARLRHAQDLAAEHRLSFMATLADGLASLVEAEHGDLQRALLLMRRAIGRFEANELASARAALNGVVIALDRIGSSELAAELLGALEQHQPGQSGFGLAPVTERIHAALGEQWANQLREQGGRGPIDELMQRVRATIDDRVSTFGHG